MSSISNIVSTSADCVCCAANKLSIVNLKRLNTICLTCCCILGIGTASLTTYFLYKFWKLKKHFNDLESKIESLTIQLNLVDDLNDGLDLVSYLQEENLATSNEHVSRFVQFSQDVLDQQTVQQTCPPQTKNKIKRSKLKKNVSFESDTESRFVTPDSSPERSTYYDDNKSLDAMLSESVNSLNRILFDHQLAHENNKEDIYKCVEYVKLLYILGEKETDSEAKKSYRQRAYELAKYCLQLDSKSYLSHKWFAITTGRVVDYFGVNEKIKCGFEFKDHLDIAIRLNSSDYYLYYLRGRWFFKMLNLNWAEKTGIRLMFGKIPEFSLDDAFKDFSKAQELCVNKSKGNLLHLAKCLISKNDIKSAVEHLQVALNLPTRTADHELDNQEISALLNKYSKKVF